jgi:hypothetical protein
LSPQPSPIIHRIIKTIPFGAVIIEGYNATCFKM